MTVRRYGLSEGYYHLQSHTLKPTALPLKLGGGAEEGLRNANHFIHKQQFKHY